MWTGTKRCCRICRTSTTSTLLLRARLPANSASLVLILTQLLYCDTHTLTHTHTHTHTHARLSPVIQNVLICVGCRLSHLNVIRNSEFNSYAKPVCHACFSLCRVPSHIRIHTHTHTPTIEREGPPVCHHRDIFLKSEDRLPTRCSA